MGSTAGMIGFVANAARAGGDGDRVLDGRQRRRCESPGIEFVRPCNLCPHMKRITLAKIRHSLETMTTEVLLDPDVAARARRSVDRMLAITGGGVTPAGAAR